MKAIVVYYIDFAYGEFQGVDIEEVMVFSDEEFAMLNEEDVNSLVSSGSDYKIIDISEMEVQAEKVIKNTVTKKEYKR